MEPWKIFSRQFEMLENSWNVSIRNMFNLPRNTHRYLIEPLSEYAHLRTLLTKRFLLFVQKVKNSRKTKISHLLKHVMFDCRSICGYNLRKILLQTNTTNVTQPNPNDAFQISYNPIQKADYWKPREILTLIDVLHGNVELPGFEREEICEMLTYMCIS